MTNTKNQKKQFTEGKRRGENADRGAKQHIVRKGLQIKLKNKKRGKKESFQENKAIC